MKLTLFVLVLWLAYPCFSQVPVPPGISEAEKAEAQSQRNLPPPSIQRIPIDPAKLKRDADELANLAASIPNAVDQSTHGLLPKDLDQKLKRIEKLAKQLRSEISR